MTAFVTAIRRNPSELWLFSLSPYFAEDITSKLMKKTWLDYIGIQRTNAFSQLNFEKLSKLIHCKVLLFYGQLEFNEWPIMKKRSVKAHKALEGSKLFITQNAGHDVTNSNYIKTIAENVQ